MDIKECFEKGLLKKDVPDPEKVNKSIEIADYKLGRAKKLLSLKQFEDTIANSYAAMFHASRALLFRDGVTEKSHYGIFVYLKEKYASKLEKRFINELNNLRSERHDISYGLTRPQISEGDVKEVVVVVEEYISAVKKLL